MLKCPIASDSEIKLSGIGTSSQYVKEIRILDISPVDVLVYNEAVSPQNGKPFM